MCGVVGVFSFGAPLPDGTEGRLARMRDAMAHRGPDGAGLWMAPDRRAALGHRRLAIIDLSLGGAQPMSTEDGRLWISYNGEVYNHAELQRELAATGRHRYRSTSDTETILHAYAEWGVECLHRFHGMWGFALYDTHRHELVLARDRIGIKPMYYASDGSRLWFASEIKALLAGDVVPRELEAEALFHYLTFVAAPAPLTLFRGIQKLPAGSFLRARGAGAPDVVEYWNPAEAALKHRARAWPRAAAAAEVRHTLQRAVKKRLVSDVPVGAFLSGGIDSSATVALMSELTSRPVRTFTVAFENEDVEFNELEYARLIARKFGTEHHETVIGEREFEAFLPDLIRYQDEPIADWVCVPLYYLSKLARDSGTIVLLVGEGSDEAFGGYRHYMAYLDRARYYEPFRRYAPVALRRLAWEAVRRVPVPRVRASRWYDMLELGALDRELFLSGAVALNAGLRQRVAGAGVRAGALERDPYDVVDPHYRKLRALLPDADPLQRIYYIELKHRLPELLLMRVDKMTMAASTEARVPFLDHEMVGLAMAMPQSTKVGALQPKQVVKDAVRGLIPDEIIDRRKVGFSVPVRTWLRTSLYEQARAALNDSRFWERDLLDKRAVLALLDEHRNGRGDYAFPIWNVMNLCLWHNSFFSSP